MATLTVNSLTKSQKRNLRRSRIRREWKEYQSTQYTEIVSKTCEDDPTQFSVDIHVYDYDGGSMRIKKFLKGTPFETIYNTFSTGSDIKFIIRPEDIVIDGPTIKKTIKKKYEFDRNKCDDHTIYSICMTAYDILNERSNGKWEEPPYDVNCDHEKLNWYGEAAYFQLMEETGGK